MLAPGARPATTNEVVRHSDLIVLAVPMHRFRELPRDLFAGKDVCVIGGGDAAAENALLLAKACPTVTLVCRGKTLRARREFTEGLHGTHCITLFTEAVVQRILGNERVEAVEILRKNALKSFQMAVGGVLIRVGVEPNTELFREQLPLDERGYIRVSGDQETSAPNVFAIGDVSHPLAPTISGATGAGATAAKVIAARLNSDRKGSHRDTEAQSKK